MHRIGKRLVRLLEPDNAASHVQEFRRRGQRFRGVCPFSICPPGVGRQRGKAGRIHRLDSSREPLSHIGGQARHVTKKAKRLERHHGIKTAPIDDKSRRKRGRQVNAVLQQHIDIKIISCLSPFLHHGNFCSGNIRQGSDRINSFKVKCVAASRHTNSYFILSSFCGLKYFYKKSVHRYFWGISETISFTILWFLLSCFDLVLFQKAPKQRVKHRDSRKHTI